MALAPLWVFQCPTCHLLILPLDVLSCDLFGVVRGARLARYEMTGGGGFSVVRYVLKS
jgi:hypothetical protein